jgi:hypothetical protein
VAKKKKLNQHQHLLLLQHPQPLLLMQLLQQLQLPLLLAPLLLLQLLLQHQPASKLPAENKKAAAKRLFLCPHCKLLNQLLVQQSEQAIASRGIFRFAGIVLNINLRQIITT